MMNTTKKTIHGYLAIALALMLVVGSVVTYSQLSSNASAEAVKVSENATVVSSPFTEAVTKVKDSVVGVNNYTSASRNNYYGFGFDFGQGGNNSFGGNDWYWKYRRSSNSDGFRRCRSIGLDVDFSLFWIIF